MRSKSPGYRRVALLVEADGHFHPQVVQLTVMLLDPVPKTARDAGKNRVVERGAGEALGAVVQRSEGHPRELDFAPRPDPSIEWR